jgi:hypothetical protein
VQNLKQAKSAIAIRQDAEDIQLAFEGTIASACEMGIGLEDFIKMARVAGEGDPTAARFVDAWGSLSPSGQQEKEAADALCKQLGLNPLELLRAAAEATLRFSVSVARIRAAQALPSVVQRSIETALTPEGSADRKMLFQHSGFLPMPKGSQIAVAVTQNAHATVESVALPRPEETIRRMVDRFNEARGLNPARLAETNSGDTELAPEDFEEEENDGP